MKTSLTQKPIKILHLITGLNTGGAEMMLYRLLSRMNRERFEPVVLSLMDRGTLGDRISKLDIPVYTINMKLGLSTPAAIWRLIRTVRQLQPDLIQGWMYHANLAAELASFLSPLKIPVIWGIHHSLNSLKSEKTTTWGAIKLSAYLSRTAQKIVFVSRTSQLQHHSEGYFSQNNCVIPNGFDTKIFAPSVDAALTVRSELGLAANTLLIGNIGRFHPMKDHANFLQAAALLLQGHPHVHFLMVGQGVEAANSILHQLIQKLGISEQVHLLGERQDIPRLAAALDIATTASAYGEAFPLVVGEAMSCGVPCVVTDVGDSAWMVAETGRVVPPRNSEALANAWQELISLSAADRKYLGKKARSRIIKYFSLDYVVRQYEELYKTALGETLDRLASASA